MLPHPRRREIRRLILVCALVVILGARIGSATEYHGQVFFRGAPVPGATVTVSNGKNTLTALTDRQGLYEFPDLADGQWKIKIEISGFATLEDKVTVAPGAPQRNWELKLLALDQVLAQTQVTHPTAMPAPQSIPPIEAPRPSKDEAGGKPADVPPQPPPEESAEKSADGLLINGSENNAATSPFSLARAFGNRRPGGKDLYTGGIGAIVDNSIFDARPYSLTGLQVPKDYYSRYSGLFTLGGPLNIPHLIHNGPNFIAAYQWTRSNDASSLSGLVPTAAERMGDFSNVLNAQGQPVILYNPATGLPFTGPVPVSPQAASLLNLYPLPNLAGNSRYNYQAEVLNSSHLDALQSRMNRTMGRRDQMYGGFGFRSSRAGSTNLFGFLDTTDTLGIDTNVNWSHRFRHQTFLLLGYHFTRLRTLVRPQFDGRQNISGEAGINGNDQSPADWGPPALAFESIAGLSDAQSEFNRNRTDAFSLSISTTLRSHELTFGGDFRKQQFNEYEEQNPRGIFTFTGAATAAPGTVSSSGAVPATGSDFADFLLGIPDASAVSFGNADKYFRQPVYDAFFTDDWRLKPTFTINAGMRWDYGAPMTELYGRLVNLDIVPGFSAAAPVLASNPVGPVTGMKYPSSLVQPDRHGIEPRIGISWRPIPASTLVVRAGYGIYDDTSVYLSADDSMAQQAPLSTSLSVANSPTCPLTLANGFQNCAGTTADTFALDPKLRVGYAQDWQLQVQRDLPAALVVTATYLGTKGTHGMQEFLPNTYPIGAASPCPSCPIGFAYRTSGGNSTREAGTIQLRRRLRSGFAGSFQYTFAKALDDDAQVGAQGHGAVTSSTNPLTPATPLPTPSIAQNWLDLRAERGLSTFDQRHLVTAQLQYTSGMGLGGGTLLSGWRGRMLKEWTVSTQITAGTGLPETPLYLATVPGTGFTGTIRPNLTGASMTQAPAGYFLNDAAYAAPPAGQWGTARRDSITGPNQFTLNSSLARTFRLQSRFNLDVRVDATNTLNHGVFTAWNTTVNSTTFGLPATVNPMRSMQITARLRF